MPNEAVPAHQYRMLVIGAAALAIIAALALAAWRFDTNHDANTIVGEQPPVPLTDEQKLNVLRQLSSDTGTPPTEREKAETMQALKTDENTPSTDERTQIMRSLQTN